MKLSKKLLITFLTIFIFIAVFRVFARPYRIVGKSMEPTYQDGKIYFSNNASIYFTSYRTGDVVLFNHNNTDRISRIVALEKDIIKIKNDNVTVNGRILKDSTHRNWSKWWHGTYEIDTIQIPAGFVCLLPDDTSAYQDVSRTFEMIPHSDIIGKLW